MKSGVHTSFPVGNKNEALAPDGRGSQSFAFCKDRHFQEKRFWNGAVGYKFIRLLYHFHYSHQRQIQVAFSTLSKTFFRSAPPCQHLPPEVHSRHLRLDFKQCPCPLHRCKNTGCLDMGCHATSSLPTSSIF